MTAPPPSLGDARQRAPDAAASTGAGAAAAPAAGFGYADLIGLLCHDLKNPLSAVLMNINLVVRGCQSGGDRRLAAFASAVKRSAERMNELLRDFVDLAHVGEGRFTITAAPQPLGPLLDEARAALADEAAARPVALEHDCQVEALALDCDRARLLQLFSILGRRAIQTTPTGGTVRLRVAAGGQARQLQCEIIDGGPGIPASELAFVFDLAWHAAERRSLSGVVELVLARGIVEAHGGRLWVQHGGTAFCFTLPLVS